MRTFFKPVVGDEKDRVSGSDIKLCEARPLWLWITKLSICCSVYKVCSVCSVGAFSAWEFWRSQVLKHPHYGKVV